MNWQETSVVIAVVVSGAVIGCVKIVCAVYFRCLKAALDAEKT